MRGRENTLTQRTEREREREKEIERLTYLVRDKRMEQKIQ
jgi:hypothetical protein